MTLARAVHENRDATIQHVAETMFKLSPQDVESLENDVVGTIPKLLAKLYVETQVNVLSQMSRVVPAMFSRQIEDTRRAHDAEQAFYQRWPDIERGKHTELVKQYAIAYRIANPQATRQDLIEKVGPIVMMVAGISPRGGAVGQQPAAAQGAARSPNGSPQVAKPPAQVFVPALPGTSVAPNAPDPNSDFSYMQGLIEG